MSQASFLIILATPHLRAVLISMCFLNVNLSLRCTPKYLTFLLVLISCLCTISSLYNIKALLLLKTIASILASSISSPSSLASLASLLTSLSILNRTYFNNLPKALIVTLLAYLYLFIFFLLYKIGLSSRLNSIGDTSDLQGRLLSSLNSVPDIPPFLGVTVFKLIKSIDHLMIFLDRPLSLKTLYKFPFFTLLKAPLISINTTTLQGFFLILLYLSILSSILRIMSIVNLPSIPLA